MGRSGNSLGKKLFAYVMGAAVVVGLVPLLAFAGETEGTTPVKSISVCKIATADLPFPYATILSRRCSCAILTSSGTFDSSFLQAGL